MIIKLDYEQYRQHENHNSSKFAFYGVDTYQ